jgi:demethylmenaquinone methyltransferase/2-methoxy-6-polyprenyl-1,4-benzoquinol methylase
VTPVENPIPEVDEKPWLAQGAEKRRVVQQMFGEIAPSYDKVNRLFSLNFDRSWRRAALAMIHPKQGETALDLCCGTGDFLPILKSAGVDAVGIDFCQPMIALATPKAARPGVLAVGDACALPLAGESVDIVTVGWGIRNVPDIDLAHREIFRVLKPGGRFVSLDMSQPENPVLLFGYNIFFNRLVPFLGALISNAKAYKYLPESTKRFKNRAQLKASMESAGFTDVRIKSKGLGGIAIHCGTKK